MPSNLFLLLLRPNTLGGSYKTVINLALPTSDRAIANEAQLVQSLEMGYIAIPVDWESPTMTDLDEFLQAMEQRQQQKVFVHL